MDLKKAEKYLNKELGFVKNTLISYPEVIKAMAKYAESEAINYSQCCTQLKDKEALTFDEYAKKFYKKTPEEYYVSKIVKNHEITKNDLQEEYNNYCLNF